MCENAPCSSGMCMQGFKCIGGACSADMSCSTSYLSTVNRCEGVRCLHESECLFSSETGEVGCVAGFCSKRANCATAAIANSKKCENTLCSSNYECGSGMICFNSICSKVNVPVEPDEDTQETINKILELIEKFWIISIIVAVAFFSCIFSLIFCCCCKKKNVDGELTKRGKNGKIGLDSDPDQP